ncbi:MAG: PhzF family phenazine biosynthesis isomerase [Chloroflexota bacterium]|jgi:PhzF family phenazine biosynthesis protein|nr:PhzF family phenazine biosynthesis isomerase [Chloroflexota bacterium]
MTHTLYQVDAFTEKPFKGNPAGVCLLAGPKSDRWMQNLAKEMNISETAYLLPEEGGWRLRWFTPKTEVDLCGHATLASAKVLFELHPELRDEQVRFYTKSGDLQARWVDGGVELDFPAMAGQPFSYEGNVDQALGLRTLEGVYSGNYFLFLAEDERQVRKAQPDISGLEKLPMLEVIITAESRDPEFDFVSRFFAPQLGVDEDPVTGSAHCLLTPYWANKLGKSTLNAYQASARGGRLRVRLEGERVKIQGAAKIIFKAELFI